jgi:hypothetical protein
MPIKPNARALREAFDALGADEALTRWRCYLSQTEAQYASAARFAATLDAWKPSAQKPAVRTINTPAETELYVRGRVLLEIARKHNLMSYNGNKTEYLARVDQACADPRAGPNLRDELTAIRFSSGIGEQPNEHFTILEIVRRLEAAKAVPAA